MAHHSLPAPHTCRIREIIPWPSEGHILIATDLLSHAFVGQEIALTDLEALISAHGGMLLSPCPADDVMSEPVVAVFDGHYYDIIVEPIMSNHAHGIDQHTEEM